MNRTMIARLLAVVMLATSVIAPAQAAMLATDSMATTAPADTSARAALADKLVSLGVDRAAADARVAPLSDVQASQVLAKADELPAGGDALAVVGLIVIILIITDLIGVTDIFPFIDKVGD